MSYLTVNDRPGQHAPSWYAETAGEAPSHPPLKGAHKADLAVVGAGFAGLSAAYHAARAGLSVILIDANRVGWGASGRNGGQLGVGPRADIRDYERRLGRDDAAKIWEISVAANRLVRDLIACHGIECDLTDGYLDAGASEKDAVESRRYAAHVHRVYGHDAVRPVDAAEIQEILGTERYHGGFIDGVGAHLHPLKFVHGLARAAVAAGARIAEMTKAEAVAPGLIRLADGEIRAGEILVACNGYLDGLVPAAEARMLPINNYIVATESLGENRARVVNRDNLCVADSLFVLNYFRLTPDHRLLWGGGESTGRRFPDDIAGLVRGRMLEVYPDLEDVEITHAWGGTLAITGTRMPLFHDLGGGIRAIGGWSGSGIHMGTMGGKIAVDAITGAPGAWQVLARAPTPPFPGGDWFRLPLLRLAMFWYGLRDRL